MNMLNINLFLEIAHIQGLDTNDIDFVLVFPQPVIDIEIWMEISEEWKHLDIDTRRASVLSFHDCYGNKIWDLFDLVGCLGVVWIVWIFTYKF